MCLRKLILLLFLAFLSSAAVRPPLYDDDRVREWSPLSVTRLMTQTHPAPGFPASSADGRWIATCGEGEIVVWDTATQRQFRAIKHAGDWQALSGLAMSSDGMLIFVAYDEKIVTFSRTTGRLINEFNLGSHIKWLSAQPGKPVVALLSESLLLYDVTSRTQRLLPYKAFEHKDSRSFAFTKDGKRVSLITTEGLVVYDLEQNRELWRARISAKDPSSVSFLPDGSVALGTESGIFIYHSGHEHLHLATSEAISDVAVSPNGVLVGLAEQLLLGIKAVGDATVFGWNAISGVKAFEPYSCHGCFSLFILPATPEGWPSSSYLLRHDGNGLAALDLSSFADVKRFDVATHQIFSAAFAADQSEIITSDDGDAAIFWSLNEGSFVKSVSLPVGPKHNSRWVSGLCGSSTAVLLDKSSTSLAGLDIGRVVQSFPQASLAWTCSEDGSLLASVSPPTNSSQFVSVWDTRTGALRLRKALGLDVRTVALSRDGTLLAVGGHTPVYFPRALALWETATGAEISLTAIRPAGVVVSGYFVSRIAFSPNNHWLLAEAAAEGGRSYHLIDILQRRYVGEAERDSPQAASWFASPYNLSFDPRSPDGRFRLAYSSDGTLKVWDTAENKLLVTLSCFKDGSWAVTDPEGRYDAADPDNSIGLHWVAGDRIIELQQLKNRFYTPALLKRIIAGETLPDVKGMAILKPPPTVRISQLTVQTISTELRDDGGGIGRVILKANNRVIRTISGPALDAQGRAHISFELTGAPLLQGSNTLSVTAFDADDLIESRPAVATLEAPTSAKGVLPKATPDSASVHQRFFAVVVGVSSYANPNLDLAFPGRDATNLAAALRLGAVRLFGPDNVFIHVLASNAGPGIPAPTKANIQNAFREVQKVASPSDVLLVYLSGHGVNVHGDHDTYYYLTADARTFDLDRDATLREASTISSAELREWLSGATLPLKQAIILDTCAAGSATTELIKLADKREPSPDQRRAMELLRDATGSYILMGSAADAVSYEASRFSEGLLTYALLLGMRGASLNDDQRLDVNEWFAYAARQVPDFAQSIGGIQRPVISAPKGATGFPIALLPPDARQQVPLAAVKPQVLRVSCLDDDDLDALDLSTPIRAQLRELSHPQARGEGAHDAPIVYFDAVVDGLPGALRPQLRYGLANGLVNIEVRIIRDGKRISEKSLLLPESPKEDLVRKVTDCIISLVNQG